MKSIFKYNRYPHNFLNHCFKKFSNEPLMQRDFSLAVPERYLICILWYLGKRSFDLTLRLGRIFEGNLPYCKLKVIFRSKCKLYTLFCFKDSLEKKIFSGIIYRYTCSNCKVNYNGKTLCHFSTRGAEHMEFSNLTENALKTLSEQLLQLNCTINFDDFDILFAYSNKFILFLRESLLIKRGKP